MNTNTEVAICVATYLRPERLANLLDSLRALRIEGMNIQLIIADNDPAGSAEEVVENRTRGFPYPVLYLVEPNRGIVAVRNRLFKEAAQLGVEFIASIDDDAAADPEWLQHLVATARNHDADVVGGRVLFLVSDHAPSRFKEVYSGRRWITGREIPRVGTGNALFRTSALAAVDGPFDMRFNESGGEDGFLTMTLSSKGYRAVECGEALVSEPLPLDRLTSSYYLKRSFAAGANKSRMVRYLSAPLRVRMKEAIRSASIVAVSGGRLLLSLALRQDKVLKYGMGVMAGIGGLIGIIAPDFHLKPYGAAYKEDTKSVTVRVTNE